MDRSLVFLSVTASYSHTNLAAWMLRAGAEAAGWQWNEIEVTRNESLSVTLNRVACLDPAVLAASFYLFNCSFLVAFLSRFKLLFPACRVLGGGPEFLGDNRVFLERHPQVDAVIRGEGERAFAQWLQLVGQPGKQSGIAGFCGLVAGRYVDNGMAEPVECLDDIPSPYPRHLNGFCKPFLLLETSRGCANRCAFCTSGTGGKVRCFSRERVCRDVQSIRAQGVPEVRLVDRTFNARPEDCLALLRFFRDECRPLRFHLEIDPARLTPDFVAELALAESGRFHLEVGLQSLAPAVIRAIGRQGTVARALAGLARLNAHRQLTVHADLIAGLPGGTLTGLFADLSALVQVGPAEIQLELLKLLPGTRLAAEKDRWQIVAAPEPPYEVLRTANMTTQDLETARALSNLVDWFYNVSELQSLTVAATRQIAGFWEKLILFGGSRVFALAAPSLENRFRLLDDFFRECDWAGLRHALHYAWLKHGFSAQNGICRARPWKGPIPSSAVLLEGTAVARPARAFRVDLDRVYLFLYARERPAAAVYLLGA